MKRYANHLVGLLSLIFICQGLASRPTGNFQNDTSTAITEQLNKKAASLKLNYFQVESVAFLTESNKQIADQQQKELTFSFTHQIIESSTLYKVGDLITGQGKALFVTDAHDHWHLHRITVE